MKRSKIDVKEAKRLKRLGYSQREIAERMDVTRQAISLVLLHEKDANPKEAGEIGVSI